MLRPTLDELLRRLRMQSALYIMGAGASAPTVPLAPALMRQAASDWAHLGSYPTELAPRSPLTDRIISAAVGANYFPDRELRPGAPDVPMDELLLHLDEHAGRAGLMPHLSVPCSARQRLANYAVFRAFRPGLILNYNLDGLAADLCAPRHQVVDVHGTVDPVFGSPAGAALVKLAQECGVQIPHDDLVLCGPESFTDIRLHRKLQVMQRCDPAFIAIVGYTFGRTEIGHDDHVSLEVFVSRFRDEPIDVYVLDPRPFELAGILSDRLRSNRVHPLAVYWNVAAWAVLHTLSGRGPALSLYDLHQRILDKRSPAAEFLL